VPDPFHHTIAGTSAVGTKQNPVAIAIGEEWFGIDLRHHKVKEK
jgi:hypothetical protein